MGDYHRARWFALQQHISGGTVYAADLGGSDSLYGWENTGRLPNYFLLSRKPPGQLDLRRFSRFAAIMREKEIGTVCIPGYGKIEYLIFLIYGRLLGKRVILFAESWYPSNPLFDKIKSLFLKLTCDGFLVSGKKALDHFEQRLKINASKIRIGYSVVDNNHFKNNGATRSARRLLCVARFSAEKNLQALIMAFRSSKLYTEGWELMIVGGGPLEATLETVREGDTQVKLVGWKGYDELPSLYHHAQVFILPSTFEPWGLVVNEAMAAGLPVLLSLEVGCLPDLLEENGNGWKFEKDNHSITRALNKLAELPPEKLRAFSERSEAIISRYSLETFSQNLCSLMN